MSETKEILDFLEMLTKAIILNNEHQMAITDGIMTLNKKFDRIADSLEGKPRPIDEEAINKLREKAVCQNKILTADELYNFDLSELCPTCEVRFYCIYRCDEPKDDEQQVIDNNREAAESVKDYYED